MRTIPTPPFLIAASETVRPGPWRDGVTGDVLPSRLDHWDPRTDLTLVRDVVADIDRLRAETLIGAAAQIAIVSTWQASSTRLSGTGEPTELVDLTGSIRASIEMAVPAPSVGGRLTLRMAVVLRSPDSSAPAIAALRPGSILWADEAALDLEGGSARFPLTQVSFSATPRLPDAAQWVLDWDPDDLGAPATGSLRLLINSDHVGVLDLLRTGSTVAGARALQSFIRLDTARALVHGALLSDGFVANPDGWEAESLGRLLRDLLHQIWPDSPPGNLRARLQNDPARLDAELQARFPVELQ